MGDGSRGRFFARGPRTTQGNRGRATHVRYFSPSSSSPFSLNRPSMAEIDRRRSILAVPPVASGPRTDQMTDRYVPPDTEPYRSVRQSVTRVSRHATCDAHI
ncbi:hypothetical protein B296_00034702 [Ensete ventricosum]|uniref:Uncharacterized protein n=1 Tax=Ensete ventricosum TaxID=4639 RepID=A0A426Z862_ENSVE|nr:hypothetical protein B296_00034702 [Ensete ventricosum]